MVVVRYKRDSSTLQVCIHIVVVTSIVVVRYKHDDNMLQAFYSLKNRRKKAQALQLAVEDFCSTSRFNAKMMSEREGLIILKNKRWSEGRFVSMDVSLKKDVLYPWTFCVCGRFVGGTFCRGGLFVSMDVLYLWTFRREDVL